MFIAQKIIFIVGRNNSLCKNIPGMDYIPTYCPLPVVLESVTYSPNTSVDHGATAQIKNIYICCALYDKPRDLLYSFPEKDSQVMYIK